MQLRNYSKRTETRVSWANGGRTICLFFQMFFVLSLQRRLLCRAMRIKLRFGSNKHSPELSVSSSGWHQAGFGCHCRFGCMLGHRMRLCGSAGPASWILFASEGLALNTCSRSGSLFHHHAVSGCRKTVSQSYQVMHRRSRQDMGCSLGNQFVAWGCSVAVPLR